MKRREFIGALGAGALGCLGCRDVFDPLFTVDCMPATGPVRVNGRVHAGGRGVAGVAVSDGVVVTTTDAEGGFRLISETGRPYVFISVPDGYAIPQKALGTAEFYRPLRCAPPGSDVAVDFQLVPSGEPATTHTLLLLGDPQVADLGDLSRFRNETLPELAAFARAQAGQESFAVSCGDLVEDSLWLFDEYDQTLRTIGLPCFQIAGNHDVDGSASTDAAAKRAFVSRYGPPYYSLDRGAIHYVFLDTVLWNGRGGNNAGDAYAGYASPQQLGWLEADLALVEPGRTVVVCQHIPMLGTRHSRYGSTTPDPLLSVSNREEIYRLLEPFRVHILTGHGHETEHLIGDRVEEHQNGAVCGAWWTGPICSDGTPIGYVIYEARGEELRWQFKASGRPADEQMSLYPPGADRSAPDAAIANVWFWDPSWTIRWYQDGQPRGLMTRQTGLDPLALRLYDGPDRPEGQPWISAYRTDHLFHAVPAPGASQILVEATDRFGRVFTSALKL